MTLTVLYFAGARDASGRASESIHVEARTVGEVLDALCARYPVLAARRGALRLARNEVFAHLSEPVGEGDVIAVIPPVAGG